MMIRNICTVMAAAFALTTMAQTPFMHIYRNDNSKTRVSSFKCENIGSIKYSTTAADDSFTDIVVTDGDGNITTLSLGDVLRCQIGTDVPAIYLTTDDASLTEIPSKEYYVTGNIVISGNGNCDDLAATALNIKGRGNSTWTDYDKKPYRLKFDKKISICGMKKAKNYVLIANFIDCTLMRNPIAFKIAQLLELPYTNHAVPVDVYLNGNYRGSYMLSEKLGINSASVDIDETKGILFELDAYYDEDPKFLSSVYSLPMMVKDPDFSELAEKDATLDADELFAKWKADFQEAENTLATGSDKDFTDYFDINSLVDYVLVNNVCRNSELRYPKSMYMYKEQEGEKYKFGPIWDFDWAYTWDDANTVSPTEVLFKNNYQSGAKFFRRLLGDSRVRELYAQRWQEFKENILPEIWIYIDEYAKTIQASAYRNGEKWGPTRYVPDSTDDFDNHVLDLKEWLSKRIEFIDSNDNFGLY